MGEYSRGLGQHWAVWGSPLKGWDSMVKYSKGLELHRATLQRAKAACGIMGKVCKGIGQHGEAWENTPNSWGSMGKHSKGLANTFTLFPYTYPC